MQDTLYRGGKVVQNVTEMKVKMGNISKQNWLIISLLIGLFLKELILKLIG